MAQLFPDTQLPLGGRRRTGRIISGRLPVIASSGHVCRLYQGRRPGESPNSLPAALRIAAFWLVPIGMPQSRAAVRDDPDPG
jgi:hypothetical protein